MRQFQKLQNIITVLDKCHSRARHGNLFLVNSMYYKELDCRIKSDNDMLNIFETSLIV